MDNKRYMGHVVWFNNEKGYGFIRPDNDVDIVEVGDIFAHYSQIKGDGYKKLDKDQNVEFGLKTTDKGPEAIDIKII